MRGASVVTGNTKADDDTGAPPAKIGGGLDAPLVELAGVAKSYGPVCAVHPMDLAIRRGEFVSILGPSGCGKTTLLRMIGGFIAPTDGTITIAGRDVTRVAPENRPTNMVFQGYGLFPHMTVAQNIAYGLRIAKRPRAEVDERLAAALELVRMAPYANRMIGQLSGGQQQRIALARALIMRPEVLLLDEPLAALDLKLRQSMQEELRRIHATTSGTFIFVTHDQEEAMGLANRICVMEEGRIVQDGAPEDIYCYPRSRFVSTFIGEANVLSGERRGDRVTIETGASFEHRGADERVVCVVRPEKMQIAPGDAPPPSGSDIVVEGRLDDAVFLGPYVKYSVALRNSASITVDSRDMALRQRLRIGERVRIGWQYADQRILADR